MKLKPLYVKTCCVTLLLIVNGIATAQQTTTKKRTIVLISGAFVTSDGWGEWKAYFESKGFNVITPAWPYKDGEVNELRAKHKDSVPGNYNLTDIVDYHANLIDQLPEKPILIGHSFGGLIVQLLLQRDKGAMGVAYHSVPPKGVFVYKYSFLKALWGPLGIFHSKNDPFLMSFTQWQYAFTNGMPLEKQQYYYDHLVVPEKRTVLRAPLKKQGKIDFKRAHAPLLLVSGGTDHIIPASLNKKNYKKYIRKQPEGSITDYKEFPGRNHLSMSQDTWKEDAEYILQWINSH